MSYIEFFFRYFHVLAGIVWIGMLYYFNFVQTEYFKEAEAGAKSDAMAKLAPRALWWQRVFQFRFLSDEAFVQTVAPRNRVGPASRHHATSPPDLNLANRPQVLLDSPLASTMVNANLRHIYWPHYEGDPVVYWQKMGLAFVGGPQVINESQSMDIFNSPYRRPLAQPGQRWIVRAATATHPPAGSCSPASATPRWTPALSASGMVGWRKS